MGRSKKSLSVRTTARADADLTYWQKSGNLKVLARINALIESAAIDPTSGIGKPEQLKFQDYPIYSRRIDKTHRLLYRVVGDELIILAARFHYDQR